MKTEINGDWRAYAKRFQLPPKKTWLLPLKWFGISFVVQIVALLLAVNTNILLLVVSSMITGTFLYAVGKEFWNVVLEESKGLWADLIMWLYYALLFAITIVLPFVVGCKFLGLL